VAVLVVTIFIVCIVAALYRAATRALAGRRQAPALPRAERTSFEDWIEIFREIAVAAEGELSPELTQLLASPSETLAARARLIEQAKTEAAGLVREAGAEAERLLGEARSERLALLRAGAAASAGPAASNWLADRQRPRLVLASRSRSTGVAATASRPCGRERSRCRS
jgi:cell division septum initiation protein DivIVA